MHSALDFIKHSLVFSFEVKLRVKVFKIWIREPSQVRRYKLRLRLTPVIESVAISNTTITSYCYVTGKLTK